MIARALPEVWSIADPAAVLAARKSAAIDALHRLLTDVDIGTVAAAGLRWPEPHQLIRNRLDPAQQAHRGWSDDEWSAAATSVGDRNPAEIDRATDRLASSAYDSITVTERLALAAALTPLAQAAAIELPFPNAMGLLRPAVADSDPTHT